MLETAYDRDTVWDVDKSSMVTDLGFCLPIFYTEKVTNIMKKVIKIMILQHNIFTNITVNQVKLFHLSFLCRRIWWSLNFRLWSFIGDHKMICLNTLNELVVLKIAWIWKKWDYSAAFFYLLFYLRSTNGQVCIHLCKAILHLTPFFLANLCIHHHYPYISIENFAKFSW